MKLKAFLTTLILLLIANLIHAQDREFSLANGKKYEIGGVIVTGTKRYNEQTILSVSGLKVGDEIVIPSERFSQIIHKLWSYKLFSDVNIFITKIQENKVFLELAITETPTLTQTIIKGVKKTKSEEIIKDAELKVGVTKVNESLIAKTKNYISNKYKKDGYLNTKVHIFTQEDSTEVNGVKLFINIDKGNIVKIDEILFQGNKIFTDSKLQKQLKNTKKRQFFRFWKRSKYVKDDFNQDLNSLVDFYKENGFRDARITFDTLYNKGEKLGIKIGVEEGRKYYFGDIKFLGNTIYNNQVLQRILGLKKGDIYNGVQLKNRINETDPRKASDANTITNLYQNNGYLFSRIMPVETSAINDTINFEIRIHEGKPAKFNNIHIKGNQITNDQVIYRELRTRPGYLYSKEDVIRTVRELSQLGFFDAEKISPNIKNPDPNAGTVDIEYELDDTNSSSQIQLQGGYGGGSFIGTVGLSFNNFSIQNIFNKKAYRPLPMGDGQKLSLSAQASRSYRSYNFSFTEPWFGGERPVQFSISFNHSLHYSYNYYNFDVDKSKSFLLSGISLGLSKRLKVPDDYFQLSQFLSYYHYDLRNYNTGLFTFGDGFSNSLSYTISLSRRSSGPNPIFPMGGSDINITGKFSLPYSLFNKVDYKSLIEKRTIAQEQGDNNTIATIDQERYRWLEFYKIKGSLAWYMNLIDKLVLKSGAEFGLLQTYNKDRGIIPFERFFVGGDGLAYSSLDSRENIQMRGYPNQSLSSEDGDVIYNKFSLELRYPITLKPMASIYALAFVEGANSYTNYGNYNPFELKKSAGLGVRIFMPQFGLLGVDFGYGFNSIHRSSKPNGWETHFIFGQQF